jgi:hypothetical protein
MARPAAGSKPKAKNSSVESLRAFKLLTRVDTSYRSGRSPDWLKMKNADAPAVKSEAEENWGNDECGAGRRLKLHYDLRPEERRARSSPNEARLARGTIEGSRAFEKHVLIEW